MYNLWSSSDLSDKSLIRKNRHPEKGKDHCFCVRTLLGLLVFRKIEIPWLEMISLAFQLSQTRFPISCNLHLCGESHLEFITTTRQEDTDSFYSIVLEGSAMENEPSRSSRQGIEEEVVEEKIDLLWEDFFCKEEEELGLGTEATEALEEEEAEGKRSSRKQLCLPSGGRIATRAPGGGVAALVAIVKLLKKMFLIRNNSVHHQLQVENKR